MADLPAAHSALAAEAKRLREQWDSLSRQHVSMGSGCACGAGGVTLVLEDFEQDIADYLLGEAERNKRSDTIAFMQAHAFDAATQLWSLSALLKALADEDGAGHPPGDVAAGLLQRLGRTLASFAKLHG
ncbi:MAG: hypothetical protein JWQ72_2581 [Polaromonas sp.]|nr:hypothetical protein [Polaromonas sp.]